MSFTTTQWCSTPEGIGAAISLPVLVARRHRAPAVLNARRHRSGDIQRGRGRTTAKCERELRPDLTNTWKIMAERGIFAFDSDPLGGPYRLIATPQVPIRVDELPGAVAEVA